MAHYGLYLAPPVLVFLALFVARHWVLARVLAGDMVLSCLARSVPSWMLTSDHTATMQRRGICACALGGRHWGGGTLHIGLARDEKSRK